MLHCAILGGCFVYTFWLRNLLQRQRLQQYCYVMDEKCLNGILNNIFQNFKVVLLSHWGYNANSKCWLGRPKKCAQCEPLLLAVGNEQITRFSHKVAAQCARHEGPTMSHPPPLPCAQVVQPVASEAICKWGGGSAPTFLLCPHIRGHNDCLLPTERQLKCPLVSAAHLLVKSGEGQ